jgi:peptide/nickel transport system substrate-binding protein
MTLLSCSKPADPLQSAAEPLTIGVPESDIASPGSGVIELADEIVLEGLTQVGIDGRARPSLALEWNWENDDRNLRLRLRRDVVLHDGRKFDSQLAAEALRTAIENRRNQGAYPALADISRVRPDGPAELVLDLSTRSALVPEDLTVPLDLPVGPYRVAGQDGTTMELERFESYYLGSPSIARVILRPFDTLRTTWASLLRGELDVVYDVPADAIEFIRNQEVEVASVPRWYQFTVALNLNTAPLRKAAVRRALNMAIDREAIVRDVLNDAGSPAFGPLWPEYWAFDRSITPSPFDPTRAASLLDEAGFPLRPARGDSPAARFQLTCLVLENFSVLERLALHIQKDLFNVGVDLRFRVVTSKEFGALMGAGRFEAVLLDMVSGPTPGRPSIFWASAKEFRGAYNVFGYQNAEVDRLFEILRTTRNEAAVRSAVARLQRVMLDDPPALFLAWNERARAIRREFLFPEEPGVDPLFSLRRWTRRTDAVAASTP